MAGCKTIKTARTRGPVPSWPRGPSLPSVLLAWGIASLFAGTAPPFAGTGAGAGMGVYAATTLLNISSSTTTTIMLDDPSTSVFSLPAGTMASFAIAAPSDTAMSSSSTTAVQIMLSVCQVPLSLQNADSTTAFAFLAITPTLFISNDSSLTSSPGPNDGVTELALTKAQRKNYAVQAFVDGFTDASFTSTTSGGGIFIGVFAPNSTVSDQWTYSLSVTSSTQESDSIILEPTAGLRVEGTDSSSALLTTRAYPTNSTTPAFSSMIARTSILSTTLASSLCFLQNGLEDVVSSRRINQTTTTRNTAQGYVKTQYLVEGLRNGVNYTAWLVETAADGSRKLYPPNYFATQTSTSCQLIYDVPLCPLVAYAVPSPLSVTPEALISFYSTNLSTYLSAFNRTLSTFPCNDSTGDFSPVATCQDCLDAYTSWLCAVTFVRCTDAPEGSTVLEKANWSDSWTLPSTTATGTNGTSSSSSLFSNEGKTEWTSTIVRDNPTASRTSSLSSDNLATSFPSLVFNTSFTPERASPFPYAEVLPCLESVCELVGARCPPLMGWACPRAKGGMGKSGYAVLKEVGRGERQVESYGEAQNGGMVKESVEGKKRDSDRFGNVFCNSLGSDMLLAQQFG
ncbi:BZ3500_MvSof-1268-A1-R1_Chr12-3g04000 [Microbotryum saponariae]|uniref:BZ3500_MvSof-1268-A1-R1_Chr12-3g04000 protein n=1 Tax=Microbotryum saponariae TaxID=289078 RepID=A0A2X0KSI3_9BASI|nr:BZ3500_MvSof-1268-A1-R1_Chr12-3g04000 [Microbotryum saponariae]SDA02511.1 BZ3501_MvSof-1269-A2-R1_Chr12-3g03655 [Microbotryum saponariae]